MKRGWFGPRRFGWGVSPTSIEGWLVCPVFVIAFCGTLQGFHASLTGWVLALMVFAVFLAIVSRTYRDDGRTPF